MTLNVPLPKNTLIRLPKIKEGLREGLSYQQIALNCNLSEKSGEKTIDRDMNKWVSSGLFEKWLIKEYVEAHYHMKVANIGKVYDNLSRIVARMVTRKTEIKEEINVREEHAISIITNLSRYDAVIEEELTRVLRANGTKQQVDTDKP